MSKHLVARDRRARRKPSRSLRCQKPARHENLRTNLQQLSPNHQHRAPQLSPRQNRGRNLLRATGRKSPSHFAVIPSAARDLTIEARDMQPQLACSITFCEILHSVQDHRALTRPRETRGLPYRLLVRDVGVALARDLALALLRTVMVPWPGAGVGDVSAYFLVEGQMRRHG